MKKIVTLFLTAILVNSLISASPFNSKLSAEEKAKLDKGEVLIRNIPSMKHACVNNIEGTSKILSTMKALDPSFVAEVIQVRPYAGNEDLIEKINTALTKIEDYVGIPYFSERQQKWYELYSSAEVKNTKTEGTLTSVDCILEMSLFGKFNSRILIDETADCYYYELKNTEKLIYHEKFTAVKSEKMKSCISVFRDGDNWVLYAIGGVDVPKIFFLEDRIETSFMNRIKTFCNFIFTKI